MIRKDWLKQTDNKLDIWYQYVELKNFYDALHSSAEWAFLEATKQLINKEMNNE